MIITDPGRMFTDNSYRPTWDFLTEATGRRLITAHPGQDWPLYIEWYLSGTARLRNPTLAISQQLSKMVYRYPGFAGHNFLLIFHLGTLIGILILDRRP